MSPQSQGSQGLSSPPCWAGLAADGATCQPENTVTCLPRVSNQKEGDTHRPTPVNTPHHVSQESEGCKGTGALEGRGRAPGASSNVSTQNPPNKAAGQGSSQRQVPQAGGEVFPCTAAQPVKECGRPHWNREPSTRGRETTVKLAASLLPGRPQSQGQGKADFKSQLLRSSGVTYHTADH